MSEADKYRHDRSTYERPDLPYRCGRVATWGMPCWQGPTLKGACGGAAQCAPMRRGDRWECRRPAHGGGPCSHGPLPDGTCALVREACQPLLQTRRWRGRAAVLALVVVLALIGAFSDPDSKLFASIAALDAGPITNAHAGFIGQENCEACHTGHDANGIGWLMGLIEPHDNDARCLDCHNFAGPARLAHNREHAQDKAVPEPGCAACHVEHQGPDHDLTAVDDRLCGNCHTTRFESFVDGHPAFSAEFPNREPGTVHFDHARHLAKHFEASIEDAESEPIVAFAERATGECTACHAIEVLSREVSPLPYEKTCAVCHGDQVMKRPLILLQPDEATATAGALLGLDVDEDDVEEPNEELIGALASGGVEAFVPLLASWGFERGGVLFAGLSSEQVQATTTAWLENDGEYEPPTTEAIELVGWLAGEDADGNQTLRYRVTGHSDPVIRAWFETFAQAAVEQTDEKRQTIALATLDSLLDASEGPGACGKCHRAGFFRQTPTGEVMAEVKWGRTPGAARSHIRYAHAPHLDLLGRRDACLTCHRLDKTADFAPYFTSSERDPTLFKAAFLGIDKATCEECHRPEKVRFDCQLCHTYHRKPGFNLGSQSRRIASGKLPVGP